MRILITNDDGIQAEQLLPLIRWCQKLGEVTVAVPKTEQSAKSHGVEIRKAFEAKEVTLAEGIRVWSVDSTPADCVRFAVLGLGLTFDLVISGVNRGLNVGSDTMYSGTVSAACEAANQGIHAIALSTPPKYYHESTKHLDRVMDFIIRHDLLSKNMIYNVNIPGDPVGIRITRQGGPYFSDDFIPQENDFYQPQGKSIWQDRMDDTLDTDATFHGYITVTPMTTDKTNHKVFDLLKNIQE